MNATLVIVAQETSFHTKSEFGGKRMVLSKRINLCFTSKRIEFICGLQKHKDSGADITISCVPMDERYMLLLYNGAKSRICEYDCVTEYLSIYQ